MNTPFISDQFAMMVGILFHSGFLLLKILAHGFNRAQAVGCDQPVDTKLQGDPEGLGPELS